MTPGLDKDMSMYVLDHLQKNGIRVFLGASATEISENAVELSDGTKIEADFVLISTGVRPNTILAKEAGIDLGVSGAIKVDKSMNTNLPDVYAWGDCIKHYLSFTGEHVYGP